MNDFYLNKIEKRKREGTLRSLSFFENYLDFYSNDYLGLSQHKIVSTQEGGYGGTGSRLISGTSKLHLDLEARMASFFNSEAALLFNSGYDANLGFFSTIPQKEDVVIYDELIHASIRDGIKLGVSKSFKFAHNSIESLNKRLKQFENQSIFVVVEGVYSMDGDRAPLKAIVELCNLFDAKLIVDEAHSAGVFGENGTGLCNELNVSNHVFARIITFGKAYGSHGACVLSSQVIVDYLVNFCRTFIYTTALPPSHVSRLSQLIFGDFMKERLALKENVKYFYEQVGDDFREDSWSPIQIKEIGGIEKVRELSDKLQEAKIAAKPIYAPTVPLGKERIRICIHAFNSKEEIDELVDLM